MAEMYAVPGETLTGIANAIRARIGSDDFMTVSAMASTIESISGGSSYPVHIAEEYISGAGNCFTWANSLGVVGNKILLLQNPKALAQLCVGFLFADGAPTQLMQSRDGFRTFSTRSVDYGSVAGCKIPAGSVFFETNLFTEE